MSPPNPAALPQGYSLVPGLPAVEEYLELRTSSGLSLKTAAQAAGVLRGSWYGCHIVCAAGPAGDAATSAAAAAAVVGMGRIISDGGWYFHIADMAVSPAHQRRGLGDAILKHLLARIKEHAADGEPTVNLFATPPGRSLYERNGFFEPAPTQFGMKIRKGWNAS